MPLPTPLLRTLALYPLFFSLCAPPSTAGCCACRRGPCVRLASGLRQPPSKASIETGNASPANCLRVATTWTLAWSSLHLVAVALFCCTRRVLLYRLLASKLVASGSYGETCERPLLRTPAADVRSTASRPIIWKCPSRSRGPLTQRHSSRNHRCPLAEGAADATAATTAADPAARYAARPQPGPLLPGSDPQRTRL